MSVVAPPDPRRPDELEALIQEARARQRKRRLGAAALLAVLAGAAVGVFSILGGGATPRASTGGQGLTPASASRCGVRVDGVQVLRKGHLVFRDPVPRTFGHEIACSGQTIWVVFFNGVAASQEGYVGARSLDRGRTWKLAFGERFFGVKAPHQLDYYLGVWALHGPRDAYFTGRCPACGYGTVSLWVTKDSGQTFRKYKVPSLTGYEPVRLRVNGHTAKISAKTSVHGVEPQRTTVTVRLG